METDTDVEIVQDNIRAASAIYFAYALEEMHLFQVVERIAQLFAQGLLPIGARGDAERLRRIALNDERLPEPERRNVYARVLGAPGGDAGDVEPNRDFVSLWLRFLVAVSAYARQHGAGTVLAPPTPANAAARKAARELALNVSQHGWGLAHFAATRLAEEVRENVELLGNADVRAAFGARDAWQVIEHVNRNELGTAVDVARHRAQATEGRRVLQWLADRAAALDDELIAVPPQQQQNLVEAVDRVLAVSGARPGAGGDDGASARPRPGPGRPVADDLLDAVGTAAPPRGATTPDSMRGSVALFHGSRGTGKTLAAYQLAQALGMDIYRVDLAAIASKYIGETEKNLELLFDRAERQQAILFFDEADALFGKRSDVKDAHDRHANFETAYLLQRLEEHAGLVIVATNRAVDDDAVSGAWKHRRPRLVRFPRPPR
jgi:hypothetical protein